MPSVVIQKPAARRAAMLLCVGVLGLTGCANKPAAPVAPTPVGKVEGTASAHTAQSAANAIARARVVLPSRATGGAPYVGTWANAPQVKTKVPVVVFLHGSSGLGLKAIGEWQQWLATLGVASVAPDSFALPGRITYTSPVDKETYEKIHALRESEIALTLAALRDAPWADAQRLVLAGASEGAVPVARYGGHAFKGRIIYSWSCENNYFVGAHQTALNPTVPTLNVMSRDDVYFGPSNPWLDARGAKGHCADAFKKHPAFTLVTIPKAPHTLLNLPEARTATERFLRSTLKI